MRRDDPRLPWPRPGAGRFEDLTLHRRCIVVAFSLVAVVASACGSSSGTAGPPTTTASANAAVPSGLTGNLTVFAAASLTEAFNATKADLQRSSPGLSLSYDFAGSEQLVIQVEQGAPADVIATADTSTMDRLQAAKLVDPPVVFARNQLEIAVAPGNPKDVRGLADLARPSLKVVLADPSVPAGTFAREVLAKAGVVVYPVSQPLDVKAVLQTVATGNADAAIVYVTDVEAAKGQVQGVPIPVADNVIANYPIAVVRTTSNRAGAQAFVAQTRFGPGARELRTFGFLAP